MNAATLLLAGLLWNTAAAPETTYLNMRSLQIPLQLNPTRIAEVTDAILYASTDDGQTWKDWATIPPNRPAFVFYAPADGTYCFSVVLAYKDGRRVPPSSALPVMQRIVVDTTKPVLHLTADRQGNDILVHWDIEEPNPDLSTLRLEYHFADNASSQWYTAVIDHPGLSGQTTIAVKNPAAVTVRLSMQDKATNSAVFTAEVPAGAPTTTIAAAPLVPPTPNLNSAPPLLSANATTGGGPSISTSGTSGSSTASVTTPPTHNYWDTPHTGTEAIPVSRREVQPEPISPVVPPQVRTPYVPPSNSFAGSTGLGLHNDRNWLASSDGSGSAPAPVNTYSSGGLPEPQIIKSPRITLAYETRKVGPSGIGLVELWLTRNDGQTWEKYAEDRHPNPKSSSITVDLRDGDRIYGVRLVVLSGAGKGRPRPVPGEAPEMRIELDTTPPEAHLAPLEQDPLHRDALILKWQVRDRNLDPEGVSLYWSENHDGPWKPIGENLSASTGQYNWTPSGLPYYVYLRLSARDKAGNVTDVVTEAPVAIDMTEPEVRLKGIYPAETSVVGR
jgi:hypothetical protein